MGISFKISRTGSRYRPKPPPPPDPAADPGGEEPPAPKPAEPEVASVGLGGELPDHSVASLSCENDHVQLGDRASFSLSLFPDGFSIGKPTEGMLLPLLQDGPELLHPYDRASMALFSAIENGWLPGDLFDDIPCRYVNGAVICEVWDYRTCLSKLGNGDTLGDEFPKVQKLCLRMGMENVVKDMPSISNDSWTYNDLLQAESRIIKALQPVLFLSPKPSLDRLCKTGFPKLLDLGIYKGRQTRKQQDVPEVNIKSTDQSHAGNINGCSNSSQPQKCVRDGTFSSAQYTISKNMTTQLNDISNNVLRHDLPVALRPTSSSGVSCSFAAHSNMANTSNSVLAPDPNVKDSCIGLKNSDVLGKNGRDKSQLTGAPILKKPKQEKMEPNYYQFSSSQRDCLLEKGLQWNMSLFQKQHEAQSTHHTRIVDQNYPQLKNSGAIMGRVSNLDAQMASSLYQQVQNGTNKALPEANMVLKSGAGNDKEGHALDVEADKSCQQQLLSSIRSLPPQMQWSKTSQSSETCPRKENTSRKRKVPQGPRASAGGSFSSHVLELGEHQRTSVAPSSSMCPNLVAAGCHIDKAVMAPAASIKNVPVNASINNCLVREKQMSSHTKKKRKAVNKLTSESAGCNELPARDTNAQFRSDSSLMGVPSGDVVILERFSKIDMITKRHGLDNKKNIGDKYVASKPRAHFRLPPAHLLNSEDPGECKPLTDKLCMSKYLIGGSRNVSMTRVMTFERGRYFFRGNAIPIMVTVSGIKLILKAEKPGGADIGAEVIYGEERSILVAILASPHHADLFAAQFASLMEREGYKLKDDQIQPNNARTIAAPSSHSVRIGSPGVGRFPGVPSISNNVSILNPPRLSTPHTIPTPTRLHPSCYSLTRPQQLEIFAHLSSMQQQYSLNQSSLLVQDNSLGNSNVAVGSRLSNNSLNLQFLHSQQHQQQQYWHQAILQSKMSNHELTGNGVGMGSVSGFDASQIGNNNKQNTDFGHSRIQLINEVYTQSQAATRAKSRQTNNQGMGVMEETTTKTSTDEITRITGVVPLLDQAQGRTLIGHHQYKLKQQQILQQGETHNGLQLKYREQIGSPLQHGSPLLTQMIQSSPLSPKEQSAGSVPWQLNAVVGNPCSPQLSSQTAGSGGSITSLFMDL